MTKRRQPKRRQQGRNSPTHPRRIAAAEKQAQAMKLREAGVSFEEIARQLGYRNRGTAYHAVMAGLKAAREEPARRLRRLEERRLDRLLLAAFPHAIGNPPNWEAMDKCLKIMARRAAYRGLDMPKDLCLTGKDDGAVPITIIEAVRPSLPADGST